MITPDEYLERVVAGIHSVTSEGAHVTWNSVINGRQFDVVVQFSLGTLQYLVLVEVKNRTRRASASDLEAFTLKARDQLASKAVFVSAAGFQSGAIEVAKRHGVDLFTVKFDEDNLGLSPSMSFLTITKKDKIGEAPHWSMDDASKVNFLERICLVYADGRTFDVPDEPTQSLYYAQSQLSDGRSLHQLLQEIPIPEAEIGQIQKLDFKLASLEISPPDEYFFPKGIVVTLRVDVATRLGRQVRGNIRFEPSMLSAPVLYTNEITGQALQFPPHSLPLGHSRVAVGAYYFCLHPLRYYHCDAIEADLVTWTLVESFQNGQLFQAVLKQSIDYSPYFIPVKHKSILRRLEGRLQHLRRDRS